MTCIDNRRWLNKNEIKKLREVKEELEELRSYYMKNIRTPNDLQTTLERYEPVPYGVRQTYPQDWPLYEKAAAQDKLMVFRLIKDAVDYLDLSLGYNGNGRPPFFLGEIVKALCIRAYSQYSTWRSESELKIARSLGILYHIPDRTTLIKYQQKPEVTKIFHELYKLLAIPVIPLEIYGILDATGISQAYGNQSWRKIRHTPEEEKHRREYTKLHGFIGRKTQIILSAKITQGNVHESPLLPSLLQDAPEIKNIQVILADAGYLSHDNVKAITKKGKIAFINGKKNISTTNKGRPTPWNTMIRLWKEHQQFFAQHYNQRQMIESGFSALKRKYGDFTRCKDHIAQENEILAKIVCFNASILAEALLAYDLKGGFITG